MESLDEIIKTIGKVIRLSRVHGWTKTGENGVCWYGWHAGTPQHKYWQHEDGAKISWLNRDRDISTIVYCPTANPEISEILSFFHVMNRGILTREELNSPDGDHSPDGGYQDYPQDGAPIFSPGEYSSIRDSNHPQAR